jgi:cytosine/adenosine deaminase-related metal-dependent hydrolase
LAILAWAAPVVLTPDGLKSGVYLHTTESGEVLAITDTPWSEAEMQHCTGWLIPGLVNAHCHLELSHLCGRIPEHTGMAGFIEQVVSLRSEEPGIEVLHQALTELSVTGTVAVADITNTAVALPAMPELPFPVEVHSFLEILAARPETVDAVWERALELIAKPLPPGRASLNLTLHAPYSVCTALVQRYWQYVSGTDALVSIHWLESDEERLFFEQGSGPIAELYRSWGISFAPASSDPTLHILGTGSQSAHVLWVHATQARPVDIQVSTDAVPDSWYVLCPRANTYIHNTLPPLNLWHQLPGRIALGTDSLAANRTLSLVDELKHLQHYYPELSTEVLLQAATQTAAQALRVNHRYGYFKLGLCPGLVELTNMSSAGRFTLASGTRRLR